MIFTGAGLFVHNAEGRFNAKLTLELLTTRGVTAFCGPPTVYRMLILEDLEVRLLRGQAFHVRRRAAQPRSDQGLAEGNGKDDPRRLRTDRELRC